MKSFDVLVIGGGITGVGIARDLAGRGVSVMLCEKNDLASATSSASTKILNSGLEYINGFNFGLARNAKKEREYLLKAAPHLVRPIDFIIPKEKNTKSFASSKLGLYLYNHLFKSKKLPDSVLIDLEEDRKGTFLSDEYQEAVLSTECWVDDARLVIANAIDAQEKGAVIIPRTECVYVEAHPRNIGWMVTLKDTLSEKTDKIFAGIIVNATGPWVNNLLDRVESGVVSHNVRWVKGSHIIVKSLYLGDHGYILKDSKDRDVYVMPYEGGHTLIGASESDYTGDINKLTADKFEVDALCETVNKYFKKKISAEDVEWTYSGVYPVLDDQGDEVSKIAKDYVIETGEHEGAPLISIYGGKISSYRELSEEVANIVCNMFEEPPKKKAWTRKAELPGAEGYSAVFATFFKHFIKEYKWLPKNLSSRYAVSYGVRAKEMLEGVHSDKDLGFYLGDGLYEREVQYLMKKEWAVTADDILQRRTKLALHITPETIENLERYLATN